MNLQIIEKLSTSSEWVGKIALFGKLWSERRLVGLDNVCNHHICTVLSKS